MLFFLAPTMYEALQAGKVVHTEVRNTIAAGLAPPFAGMVFLCVLVKPRFVDLYLPLVKSHTYGVV